VTRPATARTLRVDGLERSYSVYEPDRAQANGSGLVLVLHGGFGTGTGAAQQGNWLAAADRHGFVAVFPDGLARAWNAGICCGPPMRLGVDDVGFLVRVVDAVASEHDVDAGRLYATGMSNGGMMAYRLACEVSEVFAAVAPVAATLAFDGAPTSPVSLLHVHGLADGRIPFEGGHPRQALQPNPPSYMPVRVGVERFALAAGCGDQPPECKTAGSVTTERWASCRDGVGVELVTIAGGGHSWPGGRQMARFLDPPSPALDATAAISGFFAAHPRRR
jgi:polyhydroxybutyrate depolymerase